MTLQVGFSKICRCRTEDYVGILRNKQANVEVRTDSISHDDAGMSTYF